MSLINFWSRCKTSFVARFETIKSKFKKPSSLVQIFAMAGSLVPVFFWRVAYVLAANEPNQSLPTDVWTGAKNVVANALPSSAEFIARQLANFFWWIDSFIGTAITYVVQAIQYIVQFNDFVTLVPIVNAWTVVRDVMNLFFIVILLMIAFSIMFGVGHYSIKEVPQVILAAVVINFSRTICGLLIDASQVITLSFAGAFADAGAGNFMNLLNVQQLLNASAQYKDSAATTDALWATMIAFLFGIVALGVLLTLLIFFVQRIVYLWFLVVVSPAAFFFKFIPLKTGKDFYATWEKEFTCYLTTGPILMFFVWLALLMAQAPDYKGIFANIPDSNSQFSAVFNAAGFLQICLGTGMLFVGMMMAKKLGCGPVKWGLETFVDKPLGAMKNFAKDKAKSLSGYNRANRAISGILAQRKKRREDVEGVNTTKDMMRINRGISGTKKVVAGLANPVVGVGALAMGAGGAMLEKKSLAAKKQADDLLLKAKEAKAKGTPEGLAEAVEFEKQAEIAKQKSESLAKNAKRLKRPSNYIMNRGKGETKDADRGEVKLVTDERAKYKDTAEYNDEVIKDLANGGGYVGQAATLEAISRGLVQSGDIEKLREKFKDGPDSLRRSFEDTTKTKYASQAIYDEQDFKDGKRSKASDAGLVKAIKGGKIKIDDIPASEREAIMPLMLQHQRKSTIQALKDNDTLQNFDRVDARVEELRKRKASGGKLSDDDNKELTSLQSGRFMVTGDMAKSYGIPKNDEEKAKLAADGVTPDYDSLRSGLNSRDGADMLLAMDSNSLMNEDGTLTDLTSQLIGEKGLNSSVLQAAASREGTSEKQKDVIRSLVEADREENGGSGKFEKVAKLASLPWLDEGTSDRVDKFKTKQAEAARKKAEATTTAQAAAAAQKAADEKATADKQTEAEKQKKGAEDNQKKREEAQKRSDEQASETAKRTREELKGQITRVESDLQFKEDDFTRAMAVANAETDNVKREPLKRRADAISREMGVLEKKLKGLKDALK